MAEIRIERKRRGLGWLWLLLALIICAALAWYFLSSGRPAPGAGTPAPAGALRPGAFGQLAFAAASAGLLVTRPNDHGGRYGQEG